ncbi:MAG: nucleotide exchange factor GrpE [Candidatus Omnitrophica bacterium]|nr:nucleotide exchange factor GrpE [Candidatus Omnitrophota bacterium]
MGTHKSKDKDHKAQAAEKEVSQHEEPQKAQTVNIKKEEYESLREKEKELQDKILRLGAEFENYKKRVQKERQDWIKYAGETFILELLSIVDNFERAFQAADKTQDFEVLHKGVEMILMEIERFLKEKGVKKIEAVDKQFDPHKHEAIEHIECQEREENTIVEELQSGYELNGKVVRPTKVKVSKKTEDNEQKTENGTEKSDI